MFCCSSVPLQYSGPAIVPRRAVSALMQTDSHHSVCSEDIRSSHHPVCSADRPWSLCRFRAREFHGPYTQPAPAGPFPGCGRSRRAQAWGGAAGWRPGPASSHAALYTPARTTGPRPERIPSKLGPLFRPPTRLPLLRQEGMRRRPSCATWRGGAKRRGNLFHSARESRQYPWPLSTRPRPGLTVNIC
jgi:hypothetical protein